MTWRILYVDDEADLREIAQISLELDSELEVRCCSSGAEALSELQSWRPDLVLLDVMMPGMDGPETLRRMRDGSVGALPIVFITARASEADIAQLLALGAQGIIAKPFDPMLLAQTARTFLGDV